MSLMGRLLPVEIDVSVAINVGLRGMIAGRHERLQVQLQLMSVGAPVSCS
jgi:hypothetical protein